MTISENVDHFQYFNFETNFLENKYRFLVERTKIEKASFQYKTAISEVNKNTNRMVTTKWTYHRERSFASLIDLDDNTISFFNCRLKIVDFFFQ